MSVIDLARWQFTITTIIHFFFVPLTLGLVILVAIMETLYVRTGNATYKRMAQFWGKLFLINFAMGVVTGIVQEFQFGMNWSTYSRFVGDIFGAPLAIEALLAFYLESTFIGIWMFGWNRLPKGLHLATIWIVAIATNLSALWILIANSFMQEPVGYVLRNGRAEMTNIFALIFNPNVWVQYPHVLFAGLTTGSFFVLGISAWHLLRKTTVDRDFFRKSFRMAAVTALIATIGVALNGHIQAQHMVQTQPMKMAAAEGLFTSEDPASFSILTIGNSTGTKEVFSIRIPNLLSILAYNSPSGQVEGINELNAQYQQEYGPGNYAPSVPWIYWSFRIMIGVGMLMGLFALWALVGVMRKRFEEQTWFLKALIPAIILPYVAITAGWIMTELGRQPWIVFGLLKTSAAVSPTVTFGNVLFSVLVFLVLLSGLAAIDFYLIVRYAKIGPPAPDAADENDGTMPTPAAIDAY